MVTALRVDAELTRSLKDGIEPVNLSTWATSVLKTESNNTTAVYEALQKLRARTMSLAGAVTT